MVAGTADVFNDVTKWGGNLRILDKKKLGNDDVRGQQKYGSLHLKLGTTLQLDVFRT